MAFFLLLEAVQVDEVGDDGDVLLDGEILVGFAPQIIRYRRYAVALVDAERDDRLEAGILAHQRNVGAVQRSHDRNLNAARAQNLLGHVGRRGVRNGVVHVQHVELLVLHNVDHLAGEGQLVGRKLEQRISRHIYLVVEEVFVEEVEPHRLAVSDKVHAVAALGQGFAQLGRHHAGAAKGGITDDTNVHRGANAKMSAAFCLTEISAGCWQSGRARMDAQPARMLFTDTLGKWLRPQFRDSLANLLIRIFEYSTDNEISTPSTTNSPFVSTGISKIVVRLGDSTTEIERSGIKTQLLPKKDFFKYSPSSSTLMSMVFPYLTAPMSADVDCMPAGTAVTEYVSYKLPQPFLNRLKVGLPTRNRRTIPYTKAICTAKISVFHSPEGK